MSKITSNSNFTFLSFAAGRRHNKLFFSFVLEKLCDSKSCEKFLENMWLRGQTKQDYKLQNVDEFFFAQKT